MSDTPPRNSWDYMWGMLDDPFQNALEAFVQASGGRLSLLSGYRDEQHQQDLWDDAVAQYGEALAPHYVARPGTSNHNRGVAADLRFIGPGAREWAHENAARFGLSFPMSWEPWHIEPVGLRTGTYEYGNDAHGHGPTPERSSYTIGPPGSRSPMDLSAGALSGANMQRLLTGPLPPASAIDIDTLTEGPIGQADTLVNNPIEEEVNIDGSV